MWQFVKCAAGLAVAGGVGLCAGAVGGAAMFMFIFDEDAEDVLKAVRELRREEREAGRESADGEE